MLDCIQEMTEPDERKNGIDSAGDESPALHQQHGHDQHANNSW